MEKPSVRGPSPGRKAHLALAERLNRRDKPPPPLLEANARTSAKRRPQTQIVTGVHKYLPALTAKIAAALAIRPEVFITHPAELRIVRSVTDEQLRRFAAEHGWGVVSRVGGHQIEFYNDASLRRDVS